MHLVYLNPTSLSDFYIYVGFLHICQIILNNGRISTYMSDFYLFDLYFMVSARLICTSRLEIFTARALYG